jgi:hypothetical protein
MINGFSTKNIVFLMWSFDNKINFLEKPKRNLKKNKYEGL